MENNHPKKTQTDKHLIQNNPRT